MPRAEHRAGQLLRVVTITVVAVVVASACTQQKTPTLVFEDDFTGTALDTRHWAVYDGYQASSGETWSAAAWTVAGGILTGSTSSDGAIPGIAHTTDQTYGIWEVSARFDAPADPQVNSVFLLWPEDDAGWPAAGELDFTENYDPTRQMTSGFVHHGARNDRTSAMTKVDMTQWHVYSVAWSPTAITYSIDGRAWFSDTDRFHIPTGPMHLTLQQNNNAPVKAGRIPTSFQVDWVRMYAV